MTTTAAAPPSPVRNRALVANAVAALTPSTPASRPRFGPCVTHYFYTALDVSVCVEDGAATSPNGFYLLTLKGSQQEGLTGIKGSILRSIVVDKTRSSLESALASIKRALEASPKG